MDQPNFKSFLATVKHKGKQEKIKIFAKNFEDAQTEASMKGRVIVIREIR